ncbi:MAG: hypothetical protein JRJ19_14525, partial [Deltaproteobacteria bacterium]|nr:hypothetical protein [Deltaproteobacteria bacterium]
MKDDLIERASGLQACLRDIRKLTENLPARDEHLNSLLERCVSECRGHAFTNLALAASFSGRRVLAVHLRRGAAMVPDPLILAILAGHMDGDVPGALVDAVRGGSLGWEREATSLLLAAWHAVEKTPSPEAREEIAVQARVLSRRPLPAVARACLIAAAELLCDESLDEVIQ